MSKITCTRKIEFDAAHRLTQHTGKCYNLHGHRYTVELTAEGQKNNSGMVIDFSILKEKIGGWIDEHWDHTTILFKHDTETLEAFKTIPKNKKVFVSNWQPTAENMAYYLLKTVCSEQLLGSGVRVTKVRVWETPNCYAEACL
jgi:6-pyruvoyltetrahydropterin/6-carboxytetrahydropterin synthase